MLDMPLSSRQPERALRPQIQDLEIENIASLAHRARSLGGVIPLWYGESDLVTPPFVRDATKASLDAGQTFYVPDMRGTAELIEALSAYQTRLYGTEIGPDRTHVQPGGMQAMLVALSLVAEPGTNVVVIEPQWPNTRHVTHLVGAEARPVPLRFDGSDFRLDLDAVFARCDARTRAIAFSSPANPCGWTATREDLEALLAFSRRRGVWIVADEVYARLFWAADAAPSLLQVADPEDLALCVNSFSKAWAMTGFRIGWINHPASLVDRVSAMTQYMSSGTAAFIQAGAAAALRDGEGFVAQMRGRCRAGLDMAYARLGQSERYRLPAKPAGGMYAFFRIEGQPDSRAACRTVLEETRVGLAPGALFGRSGEGWLRMCIARDPGQLREALDRLAALA